MLCKGEKNEWVIWKLKESTEIDELNQMKRFDSFETKQSSDHLCERRITSILLSFTSRVKDGTDPILGIRHRMFLFYIHYFIFFLFFLFLSFLHSVWSFIHDHLSIVALLIYYSSCRLTLGCGIFSSQMLLTDPDLIISCMV